MRAAMALQSALLCLAASATTASATTATIAASDARVDWAGRTKPTDGGSVSFDWLGVTSRVQVEGATWVSATVSSSARMRGTRLKAYISDQNFMMFPEVQFWVRGGGGNQTTDLFLGNNAGPRTVTLENIVDPQYGTGITTVHAFHTDGTFLALGNASVLGGATKRRIEFIGDSITAATNVVRPEGASGGCGDGGYQSDWSQTYSALLCHRFGASCSTIAVGGKCVMHECGGLQMPDYFPGLFYADAPKATYVVQRMTLHYVLKKRFSIER